MRITGISTLEEANKWLPAFIKDYNSRFAHSTKDIESAYLPKIPKEEIELILCHQEKRILDRGSSFSYHGKIFALPSTIDEKPGLTVTVLESSRVGIKVSITIQGESILTCPKQLISIPKKQAEKKEDKKINDLYAKRSEYGKMGATLSPWSRFDKSKVHKEAL